MAVQGSMKVQAWPTATSAHLLDLDQLAAMVQTLATDVVTVSAHLRLLASAPDLAASAALSPATAAAAAEAVIAATVGPQGAAQVAAGLEATSLMVQAAVTTYRLAESAADGLVAASEFLGGVVLGTAATDLVVLGAVLAAGSAAALAETTAALAPLAALAAPHCARTADRGASAARREGSHVLSELQRYAVDHPDQVQQLAASGGGLIVGAEAALPPGLREAAVVKLGMPATTRDAALVLAGQYIDGTPVVTRLTDMEPSQPRRTPTEVSDLYDGLGSDGSESEVPGRITINTVHSDGPGGTPRTSYVVNLPGMDSFDLPGHENGDARDNSSNVRLVGGLDSSYTRGIAMAMVSAGVPRGATVALVGHSQGGLAAVRLASDPSFTRDYHVTHVLTAGSPISRLPKNPDVSYLSLENLSDLVPRADGAATAAA